MDGVKHTRCGALPRLPRIDALPHRDRGDNRWEAAGAVEACDGRDHPHRRLRAPVYGLAGSSTWRVDGKDTEVTPGTTVFIRRGIVHGFDNRSDAPAKCICVLTPGVLGPAYFREVAALVATGAPEPAQ